VMFSVGERVNDIMVYVGDPSAHGFGNTTPLDTDRLADPRTLINWPPSDVDLTNATNDFYTLVQWSGPDVCTCGTLAFRPCSCVIGDDGAHKFELLVPPYCVEKERNAVIRTNLGLTPASGNWPNDPELALHTFGDLSSHTYYFDDFAIDFSGGGGSYSEIIQY
jgi:hypothetical protein